MLRKSDFRKARQEHEDYFQRIFAIFAFFGGY